MSIYVCFCLFSFIPNSLCADLLSKSELREKLKGLDASEDTDFDDSTAISNVELISLIGPELISRSVERAAAYIKNDSVPFDQKVQLIRSIIHEADSNFFQEDRVQLLLDVANSYEPGAQEQRKFFEILESDRKLLIEHNPLLLAIDNHYNNILVPLIEWAQERAQDYPDIKEYLTRLKQEALKRAVTEGNVFAIQQISDRAGGITKEQATDLIWQVIDEGMYPKLIAVLHNIGADINATRGKVTPLIQAVENGNLDLVKALIALPVDLEKVVDLEFGSAVQRAVQNGNVVIENLLRDAGARELSSNFLLNE